MDGQNVDGCADGLVMVIPHYELCSDELITQTNKKQKTECNQPSTAEYAMIIIIIIINKIIFSLLFIITNIKK